ncbi:glycerate kinase [Humibacillus xanthopallidus]|uniref:Glycerate kinase n=1 Tax=Humibacillus xanthopallidus TaxID=412689 RepID=A0A543HZR7_9MICO|nr:glycerate kinase [Humibacillus xanthopallidus]TQM63770.1 glycerate kinase [Humibacillus xanthopallidus]
MRVVIAPDSYKGSIAAKDAAEAIADGWRAVRPQDELRCLPMADGGEGTLDVIEATTPDAQQIATRVLGPAGPTMAGWLLLPDGTAVVELAVTSGLPLLPQPDPLGAHTFGFGQQLAAAATHPQVRRIVAALGGSASTDGGAGALTALGARFLGAGHLRLPLGGSHLVDLTGIDVSRMIPPPPDGVEVLVDVDAPLLGPAGSAAAFAPQKGAAADEVQLLERGLQTLRDVVGEEGNAPGSGAAGGTAFGLSALWGGRLVKGSEALARLTCLDELAERADLVVTGEGRLDAQSFHGKVVGRVSLAAKPTTPLWAVVGQAAPEARSQIAEVVALEDLAGTAQEAMANPARWLRQAGMRLAERAGTNTDDAWEVE